MALSEHRESPKTRNFSESDRQLPIVRLEPVEGLADRLRKFGKRKTFLPGSFLFQQDEKINAIYVVESGLVELAIISKMGGIKIIALCPPGVVIGEMGFHSNYINISQSKVLVKSDLIVISIEKEQENIFNDPEIALRLYKSVATKLQLTTNQLGVMMLETLTARIAYVLLDYNKTEVFLTQERLAAMVGCSRITITRNLNQMQDQGIIHTQWGCITIINRDALKKLIL